MPWWDDSSALPDITWVCVCECWQTWRDRVSAGTLWVKRLATVIGSWPSAWMLAGGTRPAVLLGQLGVDDIPLGLEEMPQDRVTGRLGGSFQIVSCGVWLEGGDISCWEVEGREFGQRIASGLVHAADQHTNVAHGWLLRQAGCPMVPHVGVCQDVTCPGTYSCFPK
jgi:hypothetical protein